MSCVCTVGSREQVDGNFEGYEVEPGKDYWENSVVFAGHGAGRKQATSITENEFKFEDLVEFFEKRKITPMVTKTPQKSLISFHWTFLLVIHT